MTDESGGRDVTTRVPAATDSQHLTRLYDVAAGRREYGRPRALPRSNQPLLHNKLQFHKTKIILFDACTVCLSDTFRTRMPPTNRQTASC